MTRRRRDSQREIKDADAAMSAAFSLCALCLLCELCVHSFSNGFSQIRADDALDLQHQVRAKRQARCLEAGFGAAGQHLFNN